MRNALLITLICALFAIAITACTGETYNEKVWPDAEAGVNATSTTTCPTGQTGEYLRYCNLESVWDTTIVNNCVFSCQEDIVGDFTYPLTTAGSNATVDCSTGFTGTMTRMCSNSGVWEDPSGTCVPSTVVECVAETIGGFFWNTTVAGTTATNACADGFDGSVTRECSITGEWGEIANTCVQRMCAGETDLQDRVWPETPALGEATYPCPEGAPGSYNRTCLVTGTWDVVRDFCTVVSSCAAEENGGKLWPETTPGETYTFPCDDGMTGLISRTCQSTGIWSEVSNTCQILKCPQSTDDDGVVYPETEVGKTITSPCPQGKSGTKSRTCGVDGAWGIPTGQCSVLSCPEDDALVRWPMTPSMKTVRLSCPIGMRGETSRVCGNDGKWTEPSSVCSGTTCPSEFFDGFTWKETAANSYRSMKCPSSTASVTRACLTTGHWFSLYGSCSTLKCPASSSEGIDWIETSAGQTATVSCPDHQTGTVSRRCNNEAVWENPSPQCVTIKCPNQSFTLPSGLYSLPSSISGDVILSCDSGYDGTVTFPCSESFMWGTPTEQCEKVACPDTIVNTVTIPQTPFGETLEIECPLGQLGLMNVTCSLTGIWETPIIDCEQLICQAEQSTYNWPATNAATTAIISCSTLTPPKEGVLERQCSAIGEWSSEENKCNDDTIPAVREISINSISPPAQTVPVTYSVDGLLPYGLSINPNTGEISGTPLIPAGETSYKLFARNEFGESFTTIKVTISNNICNKDGIWDASFDGQEINNKCSFMGNEVRKCAYNKGNNRVEWSPIDSQCTMMILVMVAIIVVVLLVVILGLIIAMRTGGGRVRYDPKKAQRKLAELACV